ncbi:MAG: adenylate/guanylate cyclase domain-containing protein, partial [Leptospiraceae bacterium]|nr:adenylate/guanylate cyclase domain-containing protein [Leptospiraceae bacterium]
TGFSQKVSASELVHHLNSLFSRFDELTEEFQVEKIKTIGDAYMIVSGVPEVSNNHAEKLINMALEMLKEIKIWNETYKLDLNLRIGIHSGPLVAGVIGKKKFTYDLWGDTVNTASRMESHGVPGKIHVSSSTYELVNNTFSFLDRGEIEIKGKGKMKTFLVEAVRVFR